MRHRESTTGRLAMAGPMVLFVGIFAVCCGILTCVFFGERSSAGKRRSIMRR